MVLITRDPNQELGGRGLSMAAIFERLFVQFPELKLFHQPNVNPFVPISGVVNERKDLFDRENQISDIFGRLQAGSSVALIGDHGLGKSSLLNAIANQAREKLNRVPISIDLSNIFNDGQFYEDFCDQAGITLDSPDIIQGGRAFAKKIQSHRFLLLLDVAEQIKDVCSIPMRRQLRGLANDTDPPLRLVVAGIRSLDKLFTDSGLDSPFEGICQEFFLPAWDEEKMQAFIQLRLSQTPIRFTEAEIQQLMKQSQDNPRHLMQLCHLCFSRYGVA